MKTLAAISQFFNKTFALWVLVAAVLAYISPDFYKPLAGWISPLLGLVMFGMGLTLSVNDFKLVFSHPVDVLIGIIAQFVIMPVVAYALCQLMNLPADIAVGVILVGCCPGGTASNVMTFLARGDTALSVTITSCTTILAPLVTPGLIWLFAHQWVDIDPLGMFWSICQIVLIPIALGVAVHTIVGTERIKVASTALPIISVVAPSDSAPSRASRTRVEVFQPLRGLPLIPMMCMRPHPRSGIYGLTGTRRRENQGLYPGSD